jgi:serine protease AprX
MVETAAPDDRQRAVIYINGHTIKPESQLKGGTQFAADASKSNYILIQCPGRLTTQQYEKLASSHTAVLEYVSTNTYLCRYEPTDLETIRALPFILYANVYHQELVVKAELKRSLQLSNGQSSPSLRTTEGERLKDSGPATTPAKSQLHDVYIALHPMSRAHTDVIRDLAEVLHIDPSEIHEDGPQIRAKLRPQDMDTVASIDDVRTIEEVGELRFANNFARQDMQLPDKMDGVKQDTYEGMDEIIGVADSGFDKGDQGPMGDQAEPLHPAFEDRIIKLVPVTRWQQNATSATEDTSGHGTFVCGNVAGNGTSGSWLLGDRIKGTAPKAKLVVQAIGTGGGDIVLPPMVRGENYGLTGLFTESYVKYGARIHTNSWGKYLQTEPDGTLRQVAYDEMATNIDSFAHQHQDLVILFSAGNEGEKSNAAQIGSHASSKNVITVGACESSHPILYTPAAEPPPIGQPRYKCEKGQPAGVISNVATFSSRGPTSENRIKPDLVAPGVCLYSTRSQCEGFQGFKVPGTDTGNQDIKYDYNVHGESNDKLWAFASGTSFAAPLVAGCAAVLRSLLRTSGKYPSPTAALIKALLVNGATDISGKEPTRGPAIGPAPDPAQGFGRVNMTASIRNVANGTFLESPPCRQGEAFTRTLEIPKPNVQQTRTLTATMVFSDPPGAQLQSILVLSARSSTGAIRFANTPNAADVVNNVQKVVWKDIPAGETTLVVEVWAVTPPAVDQGFALVWNVE